VNDFDSNLLNYKKKYILANILVQFDCVDHQTPKSKVNRPRIHFPYKEKKIKTTGQQDNLCPRSALTGCLHSTHRRQDWPLVRNKVSSVAAQIGDKSEHPPEQTMINFSNYSNRTSSWDLKTN
jgi:hypothetical protein